MSEMVLQIGIPWGLPDLKRVYGDEKHKSIKERDFKQSEWQIPLEAL
jgi:hypothetical protein